MLPPEAASLIASAAQLDVALDERQASRLLQYVELLRKWSRVFNLTAIRDPAEAVTVHVLDCLTIVAPLRARGASTVLDVGSGAGLPGVVLAIAAPEITVTCVDAVAKKVAFIRQAAAELSVDTVNAVHGRIESLNGQYAVITSRAFSSLSDFVRITAHLLMPGGMWLAMKGKVPATELAQLPTGIAFHVEQVQVPGLAAERCLVWLRRGGTEG